MKSIVLAFIVIVFSGCAATNEAPLAPCVGAENSPCDRSPVNWA